jgi:hypothetical protein
MRKLIVSEFMTLDGVIQAPGGKDEDRDGGFEHGGWTWPYWHDDIGAAFGAMMQDTDAFLLGRKTYVIHGNAFEPMPAGDPFGDMMNTPKKYVVSRTLEQQRAGARADRARSRGRTAPARLPAHARQRQAAVPERRSSGIQVDILDAVPHRRRRPSLRACVVAGL